MFLQRDSESRMIPKFHPLGGQHHESALQAMYAGSEV
jgi:hypothetical protein